MPPALETQARLHFFLLGCSNPAGEFDTEMFPEELVEAVMRKRSRDRWESTGREKCKSGFGVQ